MQPPPEVLHADLLQGRRRDISPIHIWRYPSRLGSLHEACVAPAAVGGVDQRGNSSDYAALAQGALVLRNAYVAPTLCVEESKGPSTGPHGKHSLQEVGGSDASA